MARTEERDGMIWVIEPEGEWCLGPAQEAIGSISPPDTVTLLGQFMVQQTIKNAELEQKINTVGQGVVQLLLKGST